MNEENNNLKDELMQAMFDAGGHFGYSRSKRHPSMKDVMFGVKNRVELFDLEKTKSFFERAKAFAENIGSSGKNILFAGGKEEAKEAISAEAELSGTPFVAGRWLGGTLTNYGQIKTRMAKLVDLREKKAKGELGKYTKKERLIIDREIETLEEMFAGILPMKEMPGAVFIVDPKKEKTAVAEAKRLKIPVIALMSSDCDLKSVDYPIPANDASTLSIKYFVSEIAKSFRTGKTRALPTAPEKK